MTDTTDVREELVEQLHAMAAHALERGLPIPADVVATLADDAARDAERLVGAHTLMARLVAPATPGSLVVLHEEHRTVGRWGFLGPVRLVRLLLAAAGAFLLLFIACSLSPAVNGAGGDIFTTAGTSLLINELFLLAAAGMGATFAALSRANRYIANRTFDPAYEASYWMNVVLGLIAGMVLASLLTAQGGGGTATRPVLALLGGFSASLLHRVLVRLVETVESLLVGEPARPVERRDGAAPPGDVPPDVAAGLQPGR
jgi:uncharacterized membrane protein YeaQ/YmgE (transglycosylase-associated protein family)